MCPKHFNFFLKFYSEKKHSENSQPYQHLTAKENIGKYPITKDKLLKLEATPFVWMPCKLKSAGCCRMLQDSVGDCVWNVFIFPAKKSENVHPHQHLNPSTSNKSEKWPTIKEVQPNDDASCLFPAETCPLGKNEAPCTSRSSRVPHGRWDKISWLDHESEKERIMVENTHPAQFWQRQILDPRLVETCFPE